MGKAGQPGSLQMSGVRRPDGGLRLAGNGIAGNPEFRGQTYAAWIDGRVSGDRFEGKGKHGSRDCELVLARK